ncbi:hypothetical protein EOA32_14305 [Mesorhizobium sp. M1A.F.Ca.ET.072.01.1.1]|uniref:hypothetical protein n=1 Tax=Mesorhizobium sp. M1A.F.Ca.ET.072.01.1.1 TaxID=2496753 RepID=UPI000FD51793|nr:hypothetical protein [Mesorhizobium sp. M1A.F.Ca.ET.072.01.1.1]RUW51962.1 hypothetical protein EOA32_14305 [Mesorhizobium sp. M1A.F.Ca.ET.072.01.1.1]TIV03862.1 MAG: hypothetical protein E5W04_06345 [Mesorhizobium sp.]
MAEEVNPNKPAEAVAALATTDGVARGPITIDQFWDDNPLIMPWMTQYLPGNRMWKDVFFGVYNAFFTTVVVVILSNVFFFPDKVVIAPGIILIFWNSYLLAKLNTRMTRAQGKFLKAKLNARPFSERVRDGVQGINEWLNS